MIIPKEKNEKRREEDLPRTEEFHEPTQTEEFYTGD
jgi:hypothetical protein